MPIVTEDGFRTEPARDWVGVEGLESDAALAPWTPPAGEGIWLSLANDADPEALVPHFPGIAVIAIPFPAFSDGRGFSLARRLKALGYEGRLRATGALIADQFPMARAVGFDEVEIDDDRAARQSEMSWLRAAQQSAPLYRLRRSLAA